MRRRGARGSIVKWALLLLGVAALVVAAAIWWMRENPLELARKASRRALDKAGLELRSFDGRAGAMAYWEAGEGPPLVLLHGAGDQAGAFAAIVPDLLDDYRVSIPDLPGHGDSEPATGPLAMSVVYGGLEEWIEATFDGEPVTLVGNSMGAWLATLHAHRHPQQVERIVLINGGALVGDRPDLSLTPSDREAARTLMAALRDPSSPPIPDFVLDDLVEQAPKGPIGRLLADLPDLLAHLLEGRLHEVAVPVDLLWGESDQLMSVGYAERMAAQLPRSRLTLLESCGHIPSRECPGQLSAKLRELLAMAPPAAAEPDPADTVPSGDGG